MNAEKTLIVFLVCSSMSLVCGLLGYWLGRWLMREEHKHIVKVARMHHLGYPYSRQVDNCFLLAIRAIATGKDYHTCRLEYVHERKTEQYGGIKALMD